MSAERLYRLALLAYPKEYRRERGDEIVGTVLDGGEALRSRELVALVLGGVACRGRVASGGEWRVAVRAGVRLGAFVLLWAYTVLALTWPLAALRYDAGGSMKFDLVETSSAVVTMLGLLAASRGRWAAPLTVAVALELEAWAFLGVTWTIWPWQSWAGGFVGFRTLAVDLLRFAPALVLLLARPRGGEPRDRRSPAWALATPLVAAGLVFTGIDLALWLACLLLVLLAASIALGAIDGRIASAGATVCILGGIYVATAHWSPFLPVPIVVSVFAGSAAALVALTTRARRALA
jgi:hypothetical protein